MSVITPYNPPYDGFVVKHDIHPPPPQMGYLDNKVLSTNLKLGEIRKATFIKDDEVNEFTYIPLDARLVEAFQILRDALQKPIIVTSAFRSLRYELSKGRSGSSQHVNGKALDLKGEGLIELLKEALRTKNKLYQKLRAVGINGFGIYEKEGFIHIDTRVAKQDGSYALWFGNEDDDLKKKDTSTSINLKTVTLAILGFVLVVVGVINLKKRKK